MGSCGVDYLASVAAFPSPDDKLRTEKLEVQGGGNAANALTAVARLGLNPMLVTKIGGDGLGDSILAELQRDGICTDLVLRAPDSPSPFTYIIVDAAGGTRTCIHTPGAPLLVQEMTASLIHTALQDAALVYFDGRLTEAALLLARAAKAAGIPVLVEAERLRPSLDELLSLADYVVTSAHFPQDWTGEAELADAILATAVRLPRARFLITTLGTRGSILLERSLALPAAPSATAFSSSSSSSSSSAAAAAAAALSTDLDNSTGTPSQQPSVVALGSLGSEHASVRPPPGPLNFAAASGVALRDVMQQLGLQLSTLSAQMAVTPGTAQPPDCVSRTQCSIRRGPVVSTGHHPVPLTYSSVRATAAELARRADAAASKAAALNASGADAAAAYRMTATAMHSPSGEQQLQPGDGAAPAAVLQAVVTMAAIAELPKAAVVDTTGAGDAFIGTVVSCLALGLPRDKMLQLASLVAACKCTELGARPGLPPRSSISGDLLAA